MGGWEVDGIAVPDDGGGVVDGDVDGCERRGAGWGEHVGSWY